MQNSHIFTHSPNIPITPFHTKNNFKSNSIHKKPPHTNNPYKNHHILTILIKNYHTNIHITPFHTKNNFKRNKYIKKPSHTNSLYEKPLYKQFL